MNIFYFRTIFLYFLLGFLILFLFKSLSNKKQQDPLTKGAFFVFSEIQTFHINIQKSVSNSLQKYIFLLNTYKKNQVLYKQNQILKIQNQILTEQIQDSKTKNDIKQFALNKPYNLLLAQVNSKDFLSQNQVLSLNKGSLHGVKKFMGVLHPTGVVGYVFRVSPHSSQILTLLHPLSSLPAKVQRTRVQGLIESHKQMQFKFHYLSQEQDAKEINKEIYLKDKIVVHKSDQFPKGFLIGHISSIENSFKDFKPKVYVKPAVRFSTLDHVFILLNFKN